MFLIFLGEVTSARRIEIVFKTLFCCCLISFCLFMYLFLAKTSLISCELDNFFSRFKFVISKAPSIIKIVYGTKFFVTTCSSINFLFQENRIFNSSINNRPHSYLYRGSNVTLYLLFSKEFPLLHQLLSLPPPEEKLRC